MDGVVASSTDALYYMKWSSGNYNVYRLEAGAVGDGDLYFNMTGIDIHMAGEWAGGVIMWAKEATGVNGTIEVNGYYAGGDALDTPQRFISCPENQRHGLSIVSGWDVTPLSIALRCGL